MNKIVNNYSPKTTAIGCLEYEEKDCIGVPTTIETEILPWNKGKTLFIDNKVLKNR